MTSSLDNACSSFFNLDFWRQIVALLLSAVIACLAYYIRLTWGRRDLVGLMLDVVARNGKVARQMKKHVDDGGFTALRLDTSNFTATALERANFLAAEKYRDVGGRLHNLHFGAEQCNRWADAHIKHRDTHNKDQLLKSLNTLIEESIEPLLADLSRLASREPA